MAASIADFGEIILGHSFRGAISATPNGNYTVLQAKNIERDGTIYLDDLVTISMEKIRSKGFVHDGDVLLSNRGTFRSAVYRGKQENVIAASSVYIIRMRDDRVLPEFLMVFLNSLMGQNLLQNLDRGTIIRTLSKKNLLTMLPVPLPSLELQKRAVHVFRNYHSRAVLYERKATLEKQVAYQAIISLLST